MRVQLPGLNGPAYEMSSTQETFLANFLFSLNGNEWIVCCARLNTNELIFFFVWLMFLRLSDISVRHVCCRALSGDKMKKGIVTRYDR